MLLGLAVVWYARPAMVDATAYLLWGLLMLALVGYVIWIMHEKSKKN